MSDPDVRYTALDPHILISGRTVTFGDTIAANETTDSERQRLAAANAIVPLPQAATPKNEPKRPRRRPTPDTED